MTMSVADHGSLAVAWSTQDERTINEELRKLSPTLFLDPAVDEAYGVYWTVRDASVRNDRGEPIICVVWREHGEQGGRPKPLSYGIVEQVKRQEGRFADKAREAIEHNQRRVEKLREDADEVYDDISREHLKRIKAVADRTLPPNWRPKHFGRK